MRMDSSQRNAQARRGARKERFYKKTQAVRIASYLLGIRPKGPLLEHLQKNDLRNPPCQVCPPTKQHNLPGGEFPIHGYSQRIFFFCDTCRYRIRGDLRHVRVSASAALSL